jgi:hypothetical protein
MPCTLDIEASGFGPGSYPIEVGFVRDDGHSWCTLIRPEPGWTHWDGAAAALHGITRATLDAHGRPAAAVARALNEALAGTTVYCDGWAHDYAWLATLFDAARLRPSFRLENLRALLQGKLPGMLKHGVAVIDHRHQFGKGGSRQRKLRFRRLTDSARRARQGIQRPSDPAPGQQRQRRRHHATDEHRNARQTQPRHARAPQGTIVRHHDQPAQVFPAGTGQRPVHRQPGWLHVLLPGRH